ncbi:MAG: hypothetical protein L3J96_00900, partial [Thermoplasmata archaeon]|nr:hypothetical protein [Thermoplasmata archaeon]
ISHEAVLGHLAGRWFGTLRWVGVYDRPGDPWLVWSVGSTSDRVMLSIRRGSLKVLVEGDPKDPLRPEVETASWDLLRHALDRLRPTQRPDDDSLATFGRDDIPDGGWFGFAG